MLDCDVLSRRILRSARAACSFSCSTREISSLILASVSLRWLVSRLSHALSAVRLFSLCLRVLSTCTVLPVVSLRRSSSLFRSSIFSRYCWFSILSWSKSITCSTSPMSSFCCSCASSFWIVLLSVVFFSRSFSAIAPFARSFSSMYRTAFSATVLPVLKFSAPVTMSRLNSYASFLISEIRTSVSSMEARNESSSFSELPFVASISSRTSSISCDATSYFCSGAKTACAFLAATMALRLPFPCASSSSVSS
mmetsp:Transcript_3484/g.8734  ORF Transcript_3484/g.8734 Transcript_3484/m.8734 type:complete len:252 (-) Transcript_3484:182-937(-)